MRRLLSSLQVRLVAGFAVVLTAALLSVAGYVSWESGREAEQSEDQRMEVRLKGLQDALAERLAQGYGWDAIQPNVERWGRLLSARVLVWDGDGRLIADSLRGRGLHVGESSRELGAMPVFREGESIGSVALLSLRPARAPEQLEPLDSDLADHVSGALLWAGLVAGGVGIFVVWIVSRRALSPVRSLSAAAKRLGQGDLSQRVTSTSEDEIGSLGHTFNRMAEDLQTAERQRRALLADVAHELRTPLYNVGGYIEAMRDGLAERNDETLDVVQQQVVQLKRIVEDLRLLTLAESGSLDLHVQAENMNEMLTAVAEAFEPRASAKGITIQLVGTSEVAMVLVDRGRVQQVLHNLVENALTHTPVGGAVTLDLSNVEAGSVRVSVSDTGPGMDEEAVEAVFDRFYRLDPSRSRATGGAGLGLTIAKQLIEAQGGRIWAESEPGKGSSFIFELPASGLNR